MLYHHGFTVRLHEIVLLDVRSKLVVQFSKLSGIWQLVYERIIRVEAEHFWTSVPRMADVEGADVLSSSREIVLHYSQSLWWFVRPVVENDNVMYLRVDFVQVNHILELVAVGEQLDRLARLLEDLLLKFGEVVDQ